MKRYILAALTIVAMVGCKKNNTTEEELTSVNFNASATSVSRTQSSGLATSWLTSDRIGIYMEAGENSFYNIAYQPDEATAESSLSVADGNKAIFYPADGREVDFYAYYPYQAAMTEGSETLRRDIYVSDLTDQTNPASIDFMAANALRCDGAQDVNFVFLHKLSKMEITFTSKMGIDLKDLGLTITGAYTKGAFGYRGKKIRDSFQDNQTPITFNTIETTTQGKCTKVVATAILHPDLMQDAVLTCTLGQASYTYVLASASNPFETIKGKVHTIAMNVGENQVEFNGCDITPWEPIETTGTMIPEFIGEGTAENPYYVYDAQDMKMIGKGEYTKDNIGDKGNWTLAAHYKMMNDIDLGDEDWLPIGRDANNSNTKNEFTGVFDGNGKRLLGLSVKYNGADNHSKYDEKALIWTIGESASVSNLEIVDCDIYGRYSIAGIAFDNKGSVTNCNISGSVRSTGDGSTTAGITTSNHGTISNSTNNATVTGPGYSGGIAAINSKTVRMCTNTGTITGTTRVGGIVGYLDLNHIISCSNTGDIINNNPRAKDKIDNCGTGGITGWADSETYIIGCNSTGNNSAEYNLSGVIGQCSYSHISGCFTSGSLSSGVYYVGSIIGHDKSDGEHVSSNYYIKNDTGIRGCGSFRSTTGYDQVGATKSFRPDEDLYELLEKLNQAAITYNQNAADDFKACGWVYNREVAEYPYLDFNYIPTTLND